jgi:hypothetical protein
MDHQLVQNHQINPGAPGALRIYDQQPGESDLWYSRFVKFRDYGTERDLLQCYFEVMWERDMHLRATQPQPSAGSGTDPETSVAVRPKRRYLPGSWTRQVRKFDWWGRAQAWDADQHERSLRRGEKAIDLAREVAPDMVQILINLARGDVDFEKGEKFMRECRLSACEVLKVAGIEPDEVQGDEQDGEIQVVGITIHKSGE